MPRRKGSVFIYYAVKKRNGKDVYSCKFCQIEYSKHATRMTIHLQHCSKCPQEIKERLIYNAEMSESGSSMGEIVLDGDSAATASVTASSSRSGSAASGPLKMFFDSMDKKEKEILDRSLARAIYTSGTPLSITENTEWCEFLKKIRPSYMPPTRHMLSKKLLDNEYELAQLNTKTKIEEAKTVGIQLDAWSNIRNEAIINVVVTTPQPVLFKTFSSEAEKKTGEYIAGKLREMLTEIGENKVLGIVTDNGSAELKARKIISEETGIIHYGCIAHCLNLLIGDIMKIPSLKNLEAHCKQIVKEISGSHILLATFNKFQLEINSSKVIALKLPVVTRWGSILSCLTSLWNTRYALKRLAISEENANKLSPTVKKNCLDDDIFWKKVEKSMTVLSPIVKWITRLEGDDLKISDVMEAFWELEKVFETQVSELPVTKKEEDQIHSFLKARKEYVVCGLHYAANILNPQKLGKYLNETEHSEGINFINTLATNHAIFKENEDNIMIELAQYIGKTEMFAKNYLWKSVEKINPLTWWQGYCSKSALKEVAVAILSLPPSSAATERTFSKYSFIHTKKRNRLTTKRAGMLTYVACNLHLTSKIEKKHKEVEKEDKEQLLTARDVTQDSNINTSNIKYQRTPQNIEDDTESENSDEYTLHDTNSSIGEEDFGSDFGNESDTLIDADGDETEYNMDQPGQHQ